MTQSQKTEYVNKLWNDGDDNLLRLFFFGRLKYFYDQLDREIIRLTNPLIFEDEDNVKYGKRSYEDMTLFEIRKVDPDYEKQLRDGAFEAARKTNGKYVCVCCKKDFNNQICLQVDHIIPMNKGGKTVPENLQILCRKCNGEKGDT